ncbi:putative RNA methyltransferase [Niveibacterium terrae]|uniref:putative RNA methyltransferase n=1 Tax=Niveibacterium terrae TaxID=3373598 RepID=UPI003A90DB75
MSITPFSSLACPLDGAPLHPQAGCWRCASGHSFDVASQGYINLLPVQNKRSRDPGDSREMVAARRRFLEAGFYHRIAAALAEAALTDLPVDAACLDAGSGEGYYLRQLAGAVPEGHRLSLLGLDISKWAVQSAAKREKRAAWVVGSNATLPVLSGTLDRVLCLFGFPVYPEFARVLKPGGQLLMVDAGPDHLRELREIIYPSLKPEKVHEAACPEGFELLGVEAVRFGVEVAGAALLADLLAMTPHLHRATPEGRARAAALTGLGLTVDVKLSRYVRRSGT